MDFNAKSLINVIKDFGWNAGNQVKKFVGPL